MRGDFTVNAAEFLKNDAAPWVPQMAVIYSLVSVFTFLLALKRA
jgi:hypothetical protein